MLGAQGGTEKFFFGKLIMSISVQKRAIDLYEKRSYVIKQTRSIFIHWNEGFRN